MKELLQKLDNLKQITSPQDWESIAGFEGQVAQLAKLRDAGTMSSSTSQSLFL